MKLAEEEDGVFVEDDAPAKVDVVFGVSGDSLPASHEYPLFAGISRLFQAVHANPAVGIFPVTGSFCGDVIMLTRDSKMRMRVPPDMIAGCIRMAGRTVNVGGIHIGLAPPNIYSLSPHPTLYARNVIIRQRDRSVEPGRFFQSAQAQLRRICTTGEVMPVLGDDGKPVYHRVGVKEVNLLSHPVLVRGLSHEDSVALQSQGLGGKRRMGCGLFVPAREA